MYFSIANNWYNRLINSTYGNAYAVCLFWLIEFTAIDCFLCFSHIASQAILLWIAALGYTLQRYLNKNAFNYIFLLWMDYVVYDTLKT